MLSQCTHEYSAGQVANDRSAYLCLTARGCIGWRPGKKDGADPDFVTPRTIVGRTVPFSVGVGDRNLSNNCGLQSPRGLPFLYTGARHEPRSPLLVWYPVIEEDSPKMRQRAKHREEKPCSLEKRSVERSKVAKHPTPHWTHARLDHTPPERPAVTP